MGQIEGAGPYRSLSSPSTPATSSGYGLFRDRRLGNAVDPGDPQGREDEDGVDHRLQDDAGDGVAGSIHGTGAAGLDESPEQVDRGNADDRHGELDLQHTGIHMAQPF